MNLNLTEVLLEEGTVLEKELPVDLNQLEFSFGTYPVLEKTPLKIAVCRDKKENLLISGKVRIVVEIPCDRCLEPVRVPLDLSFDERVNLGESGSENASAEEEDDSAASQKGAFEKDYIIQGYNLDVDKLISGEALLNWPSRVLCREDCRGLCPVCGHNLNQGECGCDRRQLDPRMATVLDVFRSVDKEV